MGDNGTYALGLTILTPYSSGTGVAIENPIGGLTSTAPIAFFSQNGNVGIGTNTPAEKLVVKGNVCATGTITASSSACSSDRRWKKDITPLGGNLAGVLQLQPVNYYWRRTEFPEKEFTDVKQIGLIAQDVELVYPEVIVTDKQGFKAIDYSRLTVVLIGALKEQQQLIDNLNLLDKKKTADISSQQKTINQLSADVSEQQKRLAQIEGYLNQSVKK